MERGDVCSSQNRCLNIMRAPPNKPYAGGEAMCVMTQRSCFSFLGASPDALHSAYRGRITAVHLRPAAEMRAMFRSFYDKARDIALIGKRRVCGEKRYETNGSWTNCVFLRNQCLVPGKASPKRQLSQEIRNIKTRDNLEGRRGHNKLSLPGPIWLVTTKESEALKKNLRNFEVRKKRANERKLIVITNDNATPST